MNFASKQRWLLVTAVSLAMCAVLAVAMWAWRAHVIRSQDERSFKAVQGLLAANRGAEAVPIINRHKRSAKSESDASKVRWLAVEIAALEQAGYVPRLRALYGKSPWAFENQEKAMLLIARATLHAQDFDAFDRLRATWRPRESLAADWFVLDVDAWLLRGKRDEAIQLLNSKLFSGATDCGRLLRLALLNTPANVKAAWDYLARAADLAPRNPEVRLFRGQLLEGTGRGAAASTEYLAAFLANTNNAFMRDQLAEFHRRSGRYDLAVLAWAGGLTTPMTSDILWLKAAFWTRVTRTIKFDWSSTKPSPGELQPLVVFLIHLPPDEFWNETAFEQVPEFRRHAQQLQVVFWLRLLDSLKRGKEDQALQLLQFNRFRPASWHRDLESALLRVLVFRQTGSLKFPVGVTIPLNDAVPGRRHPLMDQLDLYTRNSNDKLPPDVEQLLKGPDAFAAVLLAAGWPEAALRLRHAEVVPAGSPDWVAYGFTQAFRFNRGNRAALDFAARQKPSPTLECLIGEILIEGGNAEEGLNRLTTLAKADSEAGARAAWVVGLKLVEHKKLAEARRAVETQPRLAPSVTGRELLAHIALLEDDRIRAEQIYGGMREESFDAKAYFAKRAFGQKEYATARRLTEELLKQQPDRLELRANLEAIAKAEAATK